MDFNIWERVAAIVSSAVVSFSVAPTAFYRNGKDSSNVARETRYRAHLYRWEYDPQTDTGQTAMLEAYGETPEAAAVAVIKRYEARFGGERKGHESGPVEKG